MDHDFTTSIPGRTGGGAGAAGDAAPDPAAPPPGGAFADPPLSGPQPPAVRIPSPGSIVASIPLLFGFHPENSLVVLGLGRAPGGREHTVRHGVRIDLAQVRGNERNTAADLVQRLRDQGADEAVLVAFGPREATGPRARPDHCRKLMSAFVAQLGAGPREDRVTVVEAVFTSGNRWWSYMCRNSRCCPAVGTVVPAAPPQMLADAYAALGQTVFPSRAAMDATLDPYPMAVLRRTAKALTKVPSLGSAHYTTPEGITAARTLADDLLQRQTPPFPAAAAAARSAELAEPVKPAKPAKSAESVKSGQSVQSGKSGAPSESDIADDEVARLLPALGEWRVRDYLAGAAATRENAARLLALATELARRAPRADLRLAPYTLAAWAAWAVGRTALAQCAVDRALAIDPECHFATLIRAGLHHAIDAPRVRMSAEHTLLGLVGADAEAEAASETDPRPDPQPDAQPTPRTTRSKSKAAPVPPQRASKNRRLAKS